MKYVKTKTISNRVSETFLCATNFLISSKRLLRLKSPPANGSNFIIGTADHGLSIFGESTPIELEKYCNSHAMNHKTYMHYRIPVILIDICLSFTKYQLLLPSAGLIPERLC